MAISILSSSKLHVILQLMHFQCGLLLKWFSFFLSSPVNVSNLRSFTDSRKMSVVLTDGSKFANKILRAVQLPDNFGAIRTYVHYKSFIVKYIYL